VEAGVAEHLSAALIGVGVMITVWLAFGVGLGFDWPLHVSDGSDGRPSTSKFQFFVWTAVILWGYSAVAAARVIAGASPGGIGMPTNLFILMGLGAGTALGAKLATLSHGGRPMLADPTARTYRSLVADDDGNAALEKIQVLAWTFVAVGVFVVSVWQNLAAGSPPSSLPNVDDALLVLLGIWASRLCRRQGPPALTWTAGLCGTVGGGSRRIGGRGAPSDPNTNRADRGWSPETADPRLALRLPSLTLGTPPCVRIVRPGT
jgi:hypothetical protein